MEKQYSITCDRGKHVQVLGYEEMVKVFGEEKVSEIDAGTLRIPARAPSCLECDDDEQAATERDIHDLGLEMSAVDGYYYE